jgi:Flp pilus assembly pilin Flp
VLLLLYVRAFGALARRCRPVRGEAGQTTAEYALVLVGVAAIALLVVAWASDTNKIGRLLDGVLDSILDQIP